VKEHREPPRRKPTDEDGPAATIGIGEGGEPSSPRRFARLVSQSHVRRVSRSKIVLAILALVPLLMNVPWAWRQVRDTVTSFVHRQPAYQVRFSEITLDPPPPAWYLGGSSRFLKQVRHGSGHAETFSLLDLDPAALGKAFRVQAWVRKASVERKNPNRVIVHLEYREPVAYVDLKEGGVYLLDREAVLLNPDDLDVSSIDLRKQKFRPELARYQNQAPPFEPQFGKTWKSLSGTDRTPKTDEQILVGARFAAALHQAQAEDLAKGTPLVFNAIVVQAEKGVIDQSKLILWVQTQDNVLLKWMTGPDDADPVGPDFPEKWDLAKNWANAPKPRGVKHFDMTDSGIVPTSRAAKN